MATTAFNGDESILLEDVFVAKSSVISMGRDHDDEHTYNPEEEDDDEDDDVDDDFDADVDQSPIKKILSMTMTNTNNMERHYSSYSFDGERERDRDRERSTLRSRRGSSVSRRSIRKRRPQDQPLESKMTSSPGADAGLMNFMSYNIASDANNDDADALVYDQSMTSQTLHATSTRPSRDKLRERTRRERALSKTRTESDRERVSRKSSRDSLKSYGSSKSSGSKKSTSSSRSSRASSSGQREEEDVDESERLNDSGKLSASGRIRNKKSSSSSSSSKSSRVQKSPKSPTPKSPRRISSTRGRSEESETEDEQDNGERLQDSGKVSVGGRERLNDSGKLSLGGRTGRRKSSTKPNKIPRSPKPSKSPPRSRRKDDEEYSETGTRKQSRWNESMASDSVNIKSTDAACSQHSRSSKQGPSVDNSMNSSVHSQLSCSHDGLADIGSSHARSSSRQNHGLSGSEHDKRSSSRHRRSRDIGGSEHTRGASSRQDGDLSCSDHGKRHTSSHVRSRELGGSEHTRRSVSRNEGNESVMTTRPSRRSSLDHQGRRLRSTSKDVRSRSKSQTVRSRERDGPRRTVSNNSEKSEKRTSKETSRGKADRSPRRDRRRGSVSSKTPKTPKTTSTAVNGTSPYSGSSPSSSIQFSPPSFRSKSTGKSPIQDDRNCKKAEVTFKLTDSASQSKTETNQEETDNKVEGGFEKASHRPSLLKQPSLEKLFKAQSPRSLDEADPAFVEEASKDASRDSRSRDSSRQLFSTDEDTEHVEEETVLQFDPTQQDNVFRVRQVAGKTADVEINNADGSTSMGMINEINDPIAEAEQLQQNKSAIFDPLGSDNEEVDGDVGNSALQNTGNGKEGEGVVGVVKNNDGNPGRKVQRNHSGEKAATDARRRYQIEDLSSSDEGETFEDNDYAMGNIKMMPMPNSLDFPNVPPSPAHEIVQMNEASQTEYTSEHSGAEADDASPEKSKKKKKKKKGLRRRKSKGTGPQQGAPGSPTKTIISQTTPDEEVDKRVPTAWESDAEPPSPMSTSKKRGGLANSIGRYFGRSRRPTSTGAESASDTDGERSTLSGSERSSGSRLFGGGKRKGHLLLGDEGSESLSEEL